MPIFRQLISRTFVVLGLSLTWASGLEAALATQPADTQPSSTQPVAPPATMPEGSLPLGGAGKRPAPPSPGDLSSLSLEDLMNVEVTTVSRQKQRASEAPAAVTVITQDDIQRSGLTTIPDLLRLAPGMDVARLDANKWAISSRGFNDTFSNKLLVLMDGRAVYTPAFGGVNWGQQDYILSDLDRIEVVRGPGATLWGANAVNGVVNILSKSAQDTQGWQIEGLAGTQQQAGSVRFGGRIDEDTYFRVYTKYSNFDDLANAAGGSANDAWKSLQAGFRLDRTSSPADTFTFQGDLYGQNLSQAAKDAEFTPPYLAFENEHFTADGGNLLGRWTHAFSPTSNFALQAYYDRTDRFERVNGYQQNTFDIDFQHRFSLSKHQELIWGGGYRVVSDHWTGDDRFTISPSSQTTQLASAFIQDDMTLVPDRLHLILGTKLEYSTFVYFEAEPGARLLWTPNETHTVWGSVSRAVRNPSLAEEDLRTVSQTFPVGGGVVGASGVVNNRDLKAEQLLAYELGYRVKPLKNVSFDFTAFYNDYEKLVGVRTAPTTISNDPLPPHPFFPVQWENNMKGETYGGELAANWAVTDNWRLVGSYSFMEIQLHGPGGASAIRETYFERTSPQHQLQLRSYMNLTRHLQLNGMAYYVSPLLEGHIPAYVRLDANVAWIPNDRFQLMVGVQNILDDRHPEFPQTGTYTAASEDQRQFFARASWRF